MLFVITYDFDVKSGLEVLCCELKQIKIQYNRIEWKNIFLSQTIYFSKVWSKRNALTSSIYRNGFTQVAHHAFWRKNVLPFPAVSWNLSVFGCAWILISTKVCLFPSSFAKIQHFFGGKKENLFQKLTVLKIDQFLVCLLSCES